MATYRCQWREAGPQIKKFEQVSSDIHQMSLSEGPGWAGGSHVWYLGWVGLGLGLGLGLGPGDLCLACCSWSNSPSCSAAWIVYSEVQCIMDNDHVGDPLWTNRHTQMKTLPSRNFVGKAYRSINIRNFIITENLWFAQWFSGKSLAGSAVDCSNH